MQLAASSSRIFLGTKKLSKRLGEWFPTPALLEPRAAGMDISDSSIKWLALVPNGSGYRIDRWGEEPLAAGVVEKGVIKDVARLASALAEVRGRLGGVACAHVALPEEAAYVFDMHVPAGEPRAEIAHMIEFESEGRVPIPVSSTVYDFDIVDTRADSTQIAVAAFPRDLAESYAQAFDEAGLTLLSLELEARSIARALMNPSDCSVVLLVDFGRERTGLAVIKCGIPIFTSTVEVGGDGLTRALVQELSLSPQEAEKFRNEQGLLADGKKDSAALATISGVASALADEVTRHYRYWDTRRNESGERMTPVARVVLTGGSSNLRGLDDFLASRVQAPVERGNVWLNICCFDEYIPPIDRPRSLQFATAAGLALRSVKTV